MKLTPVLYTDEIETSLTFWVDRMGFTKTAEVPEGDRLGFAILVNGAAELMLQTWASLDKDAPGLVKQPQGGTALFIEVDDFDDTLRRIAGCDIALPDRTTFYGMREIGVRTPSGHVAVFAKHVK